MDINDKTILVTGASSGIGKAAAQHLAKLGARVVIVCRNERRGEPALHDIRKRSGNPSVELLTADLGSQEQTRALARKFSQSHDRLDVLINNAGLYLSKRTVTDDGIETTFAVNHLAPFLLTNLLLDTLKASSPSRVITVSSEAHRRGTIDFEDLCMERRYNWIDAYARSKLANVLFTYELARRLEGTGVTALTLHPGVVATRIWNRNRNPLNYLLRIFKVFYISPRKSAESVVRLATAPELAAVTGKYFNRDREVRSSRASCDMELAGRLWDVSEEMTGLRSGPLSSHNSNQRLAQ